MNSYFLNDFLVQRQSFSSLFRMKIFAAESHRQSKRVELSSDLVIVGGGLAGVCAALVAAREGLAVTLVQDRPVLGGNASSEVRLWALGATSHLGNNNRWSREGGVIDELLIENLYRNPEGNPNLFDAVLQDKILAESNINLLLDTMVFDVEKSDERTISSVTAFCGHNGTVYSLCAPRFCDASGDGLVGFMAGASFRMGAESASEFDEAFAPPEAYGGLLGHSMYFYSRDTGKPVKFVPPDFALKDITDIPRYRNFRAGDTGCQLWWLEFGGRFDTVHDTRKIKTELQKVIFGVWNYIKNSGEFPEAENLTLEWVGQVPGKRESRRFEGDVMISQRDVIEQRDFYDGIAFGGWAIDLHPGDGVYSKLDGCTQWHSKGVYQIPYRAMYSRDLDNLFLAGRIISATHVALGSLRVMATTAHSAQAVGMAAALCQESDLTPRALSSLENVRRLQQRLLRIGHYIPRMDLADAQDLVPAAEVETSSRFELGSLLSNHKTKPLNSPMAMLLPFPSGPLPAITFFADSEIATELEVQLRLSQTRGNFTPDVILETVKVLVPAGKEAPVKVGFESVLEEPQYAFICVLPNSAISLALSDTRVTGVLSVSHERNGKVSKSAVQDPPPGIGIDRMEFWLPGRRPGGENFALSITPPLQPYAATSLQRAPSRPTTETNAWVAAIDDPTPEVTLTWPRPATIDRIVISFDNDFDHPLESVQMGHPERVIPFCVSDLDIIDAAGAVLHRIRDNHQTLADIRFPDPVSTAGLKIRVLKTHGAPAALFRIQCFAPEVR
ncbi:MAG: hypothetical protein SynsKO_30250 [Synoicihabitans sp.]